MKDLIFDIQAEFCKVMCNSTRLQIIHTLREGSMKVGEITKATGFPQPTVSRQLSTLRNVGVVQSQKNGNETVYQLTDEDIVEVCDLVRKVLTTRVQNQFKSLMK